MTSPAPVGAPEGRARRRLAIGLMLAAPLVAEFVSGNLPIIYVWLLVIYVPLYGGAALLIREIGRRSARPWPVIVTLALAYGGFEESFVSFSIFNRSYADLQLLDFGWIPALGIGAWWTVFVVVLHAVWSICVPIVLVESFADARSDQPWLARPGLVAASCALLGGAGVTVAITLSEDPFVPRPGQLAGAAVAIMVLVGVATLLARRPARVEPPPTSSAPVPGFLVAVSALAGVAFVAGAAQSGPAAVTLAGYAVIAGTLVVGIVRWSRREGWNERSRLALATGALIPHVAFALLQPSIVDVPLLVDLSGDLLFATALAVVLVMGWRHTADMQPGRGRRAARPSGRRPTRVDLGPWPGTSSSIVRTSPTPSSSTPRSSTRRTGRSC